MKKTRPWQEKWGKVMIKKCHAEKHPTVFCMKGKSCVIPRCGFSFCSYFLRIFLLLVSWRSLDPGWSNVLPRWEQADYNAPHHFLKIMYSTLMKAFPSTRLLVLKDRFSLHQFFLLNKVYVSSSQGDHLHHWNKTSSPPITVSREIFARHYSTHGAFYFNLNVATRRLKGTGYLSHCLFLPVTIICTS